MGFFWSFIAGAATSWVVQGRLNQWRKRQEATQLRKHVAYAGAEQHARKNQQPDAGRLAAQPDAADSTLGALSADQETMAEDLSTVIVLDRLESIQGITPAIARLLNQAGILTYADLAGQTPEHLRDLVTSAEPEDRPVQDWIAHARDLAVRMTCHNI